MSASWKTVYEGQHEGRSVTVKESNDGTFKVLTTQNYYEDGGAYQDGKTFVHVSPSSVGEPVESEATSREGLQEALRKLHFPSDAVSAIMDGLA
ncbi:hypothetical protein P3W24_12570 [Luteibacter sp. PPL201]|uniref:Uncharacterized protein n=1 Tax=Luteibacter sahnii TaxID=3021977 RepID=A0ABT6BCN1_9GAMM|nr:hypothetical protein [Luteibacter sp. PPL193]MDY1549226.1 hypothetical protein [Luteibacter sp. PPL193]